MQDKLFSGGWMRVIRGLATCGKGCLSRVRRFLATYGKQALVVCEGNGARVFRHLSVGKVRRERCLECKHFVIVLPDRRLWISVPFF